MDLASNCGETFCIDCSGGNHIRINKSGFKPSFNCQEYHADKRKGVCLGCLKSFPILKKHPIFCGQICSSCCENLIRGTTFNEESPEYCVICGKTGEVVECSNKQCEINGVLCKNCISMWDSKRGWPNIVERKHWLCMYCCDPCCSTVIKQENWIRNLCTLVYNEDAKSAILNTSDNPISVLSINDGIGSGFLAMKQLGWNIFQYIAQNSDEDAVRIAQKKFCGQITHVDITMLNYRQLEHLGKIDLLIGGIAISYESLDEIYDINSTNILFFEFYRILSDLRVLNPNICFLWRIGASVQKEFINVISRYLKCNPVFIDIRLFLPVKKGLYVWGNVPQINDLMKNIPNTLECSLYNILEDHVGRTPLISTVRPINIHSEVDAKYLPILMDEKKDHLWITEIEKLFGFHEHFTDVGDISVQKRIQLIENSWCISLLRFLLRMLSDN